MAGAKQKTGRKVIASNKNARREFQIHETYEAGLVLRGTEAKSIRQGMATMTGAHAYRSGPMGRHEVFSRELGLSGTAAD